MIRDLSIVTRFSADGRFSQEYLFFGELAGGEWVGERYRAHVFETHLEADAEARSRPYLGTDGHSYRPWAIVLGGEEQAAVATRAVEKVRRARSEGGRPAVAPEEAFRDLEKRRLA